MQEGVLPAGVEPGAACSAAAMGRQAAAVGGWSTEAVPAGSTRPCPAARTVPGPARDGVRHESDRSLYITAFEKQNK